MASKARMLKPVKAGPSDNKKTNPASEQKGKESSQKPSDSKE